MTNVISFADRKAVGDNHEQRVRAELAGRGWTVDRYGQDLLSEPTRRALGRTESRLRFDVDMVASLGSTICVIDAKGSMRGEDAFTYRVSRKSLDAGRRLAVEWDLPFYYVFANLGVATPFEVMQFQRLTTIGEAPGYISFGSGLLRPFDDVFGIGAVAGNDAIAA